MCSKFFYVSMRDAHACPLISRHDVSWIYLNNFVEQSENGIKSRVNQT